MQQKDYGEHGVVYMKMVERETAEGQRSEGYKIHSVKYIFWMWSTECLSLLPFLLLIACIYRIPGRT